MLHTHGFTRWMQAALSLGIILVSTVAFAQGTATTNGNTASTPAVATTSPVPFTSPNAENITVPSAPDAWGGPRTAADATLSDEVVSYTIKATLNPDKHTVDATEHMTWRNRSKRPISKVYFHLYLNAFANPESTFFTERRMFSGSGGSRGAAKLKQGEWGYIDLKQVTQDGQPVVWRYVHPDNGPRADHTVVEFDLPKAIPPGGTMALDIAFHDHLSRVVERTGWFGKFHLVAQWFPKIGVLELPGERGATRARWNVHEFHFHSEFYADYGNYDVTLTVPKDYTVGAVGMQQGKPVINGDQATYRFVQHDVEDFAWVAAPGFKTMSTAWTGPGSPRVTVKVIYPPEYVASARPVLKATTDALTYFSNTLGPYPYKTVTAVVPPYNASEAGGMEYPTFFTASGYASVTPGTTSQYGIEFVTIHEFGHGYFMGILGSNEFEEPMLDEGMNEYWDQRMFNDRDQPVHMTTPFLRWLGIDPTVDPFVLIERLGGVVSLGYPPDSLDSNSWDRMSNSSYGAVYARTASTMHTLENLIGHEAMGKAMKVYYERWKFRHPSAADLRVALEEASGRPKLVDSIFASQVYGTERVDDRIVSVHSVHLTPRPGSYFDNGKRATRTRKDVDKTIQAADKAWEAAHPKATSGGAYRWRSYVVVQREGAPIRPVPLKVTFADGSTKTVEWNGDSRWKRFHWDAPTKIVAAELDPEHKNFLDVNKLNDSYAVKPNSAASRRWTSDVAALVKAAYTFVVTL